MENPQSPWQPSGSQPHTPQQPVQAPHYAQPAPQYNAPSTPAYQVVQPQQDTPPQHLYHDVSHPGGLGVPPKRGGKAVRMAVAGLATLLVVAGGGYVFGVYLPNKPTNVFNAALSNTSAGYDQLIKYASASVDKKSFNNVEVSGDFKAVGGGVSTDGSLQAHSDGSNATFSGDIGVATTRVKVDGLVKDVANSDSPDFYLKVSGIKGLGSMVGLPTLDSLDNQWITVDHTLFDTIAQQSEQAQGLDAKNSVNLPKEQDLTDAANAVGKVADKYLFSSDSKTASLKLDSFVGKETVDGKSTNHYKVTPNKEHLKAFATALATELDKTALNKWAKDNYNKSLSDVVDTKGMADSINHISSTTKFDVWVNTKTKLVHKVRFSDSKDPAHNYTEFGLNYNGGAEKPLFIRTADNKDGIAGVGTFGLTLNTNTNVAKFTIDVTNTGSDASQNSTMTLNLTAKPSTGKVDTTAPTGAISLSEALDRIGLGDYLNLLTQSGLGQQSLSQGSSSQTDPFTISL